MGNKGSLALLGDDIRRISDQTGFSASQIEKLHARFSHLDSDSDGALTANDLRAIPELAANPLCERLLQLLLAGTSGASPPTSSATPTASGERRLDFHQFMRALAAFRALPAGSGGPQRAQNGLNLSQAPQQGRRAKLSFVFSVYDTDGDGKISFHDLRAILKLMVGAHIETIQLDKIATRAFVELDLDNDGFIGFEEFCDVFSLRDLDDKLVVRFFN